MSAISFLAGLGAGYLAEDDKQTERKRQSRLDQITFDRAQRDTDTYNEQQSNRAAVRTAAAPLPVENVDGVGPPAEDGTTPRSSYRVGAAQFADQGAATAAANDPTARDGRIASVMRGIDPGQAQQFEQGTKQAKLTDVQMKEHIQKAQTEGTMRALSAALAGQTPAEVESIFNSSGDTKVHNLQFTPIDVNHPVLGPQKSMRITGTRDDGQPFVLPDAVDASFKLFNAEKQFGMLVDAKKDATKNKKDDRELDIRDNAQKSLSRYHDAIAGAAGVRAENSGKGKATGVDRMSEADKEEYKGVKDQVKAINAEITKAQAADNWNEASDNAKRLKTQVASLNLRGRAILDRYAAEDDAPDPIGLRKPAAAASAGVVPTRVDPGTQDVRDTAAGKQMVLTEFGGDVNRARSELAAMQDGIRKAPSGEARMMLESQAKRLQLGISAMGAAPAPARMAAAGVAPPPAAAVVPKPALAVQQGPKPTGDATMNAIQARNMEALVPLTDAVVQAKQQLAAVAKSGDPKALARYAAALQQARDARAAAAEQTLGNNAPQYLASVEP